MPYKGQTKCVTATSSSSSSSFGLC